MGDTVIGIAASTDDQSPLRYAPMEGFAPSATFTLVETAARLSREAPRAPCTSVRSSRPGSSTTRTPTTFARWKRLGHLGVEMEAAMMYTIAAVKGIESLAIMTVSDLLGESGDTVRISDDELKAGVDQMMRISCAVAVS